MPTIDLNCDMGESFGAYKLGRDEDVIKFISSANIACGWHAGDAMVMNRSVQLAAANGVGVGAHPSYPDLMGFGRRNMDCTAEEIRNYVTYQIGALSGFCAANGVKMRHVKPHGALYLTAVEDETVATAIAEAIVSVDPSLMYVAFAGPRGALMSRIGEKLGLKVLYEAFPDRAYTPDGTLASRRSPGAVISDPNRVAERALKMAKEGKVVATDGTEIDLQVHTLCVHGDNPSAVAVVKTIRALLGSDEIEVKPWAFDESDSEQFIGGLMGGLFDKAVFRLVGDTGVIVEYGDEISPEINIKVRTMAMAIAEEKPVGIVEVIPTYRSLLIVYDPLATDLKSLEDALQFLEGRLDRLEIPPPRIVEIPVSYGGDLGPDIEFVAQAHNLTVEDVIRIHSRPLYQIYMIGFTPGFPFLGGLPEELHTPRQETPRPLVPAGSVGIANNQTGVYPIDSPGGWRLIGRTPLSLFNPSKENPFLYRTGDMIKFVLISEEEYHRILSEGNR
jgi:UPF0271 protein